MKLCVAALLIVTCACAAESLAHDPRVVWTGAGVNLLGGPSRDGRFLSYVDAATRDLAIRDLATGQSRLLTHRAFASKEFAYFSAISNDSARVAYAWFNAENYYELRVTGIDGTGEKVLYRNEEAGFVQPCAWSPDNKFILTLFFRKDNISQIALVPSEGGPMKVLRSLNWVYPKKMDFSPDGESIVYDSFAEEGSGDRSIFSLAVDGTREIRLIEEPGNHLFPLWTPDGKHVIYASDRGGTMDAWILDIDDGKPSGSPRLLRRDIGRFLPMGITRHGQYYFGVRSGVTDVFVSNVMGTTVPLRATMKYPGRNSMPAWSRDGHALAYLSRRGSENFGQESRVIVIRSFDPGSERELLPVLAHMERIRWSPDGRSLLVSGSDNKGRGGVYIVDAKTAGVKPVAREAGASFRGFDGVWSHDGKTVFYIYSDSEVRSHDIATGREATLFRGSQVRHIAIAPDGKTVGFGDGRIVLVPVDGGEPRIIRFEGLTELEWDRELFAGKGAELWRIPLDGAAPQKLPAPGNRTAGFSVHPDGKRVALTASDARSEVWVMPLPQQ